MVSRKRVDLKIIFSQLRQPMGDELPDDGKIQALMRRRIFFQICLRELEQGGGRTQAVFLEMHKRAGELDQSLVKISVCTVAIRQPQVFQHIVRLVKSLRVEQREEAGVTRVNPVIRKLPREFRNALVLVHTASLWPEKRKVAREIFILLINMRFSIMRA